MKQLWKNYIASGLVLAPEKRETMQIAFVNSFSLLGILTLLGFGAVNILKEGDSLTGSVEIGFGLLLIISLCILRILKLKWLPFASSIMIISIAFPLLVLLFTGGIAGTGIFWIFTFPVTVLFLEGKKKGGIWVIILCLLLGMLAILSAYGFVDLYYSEPEIRQLIFCLLVVSGVIYFFENISEKKSVVIEEQRKDLQNANVILMERADIAEVAKDELEEKKKTLEEKAAELQKSQEAILNVFEDLDAEKAKLKEKDQQLEDAQNAGDVGTFTWDLTDNKINISSHVYEMYGISPDSKREPIENFLSLIHQEDRNEVAAKMQEIPKSELPFELTYRCIWPNGTIKWLRARGRTLYSQETKRPSEVIGTIHDITKEKEVEKLKDEFVSIASHELRTPMGAIKAFVSMILSGDYGPVNDNLEDPLKDIKTNTERLVSLVNDLLNIARIEARRMKFELIDVDAASVVGEICESLVPLAKQKNLELRYSVIDAIRVQMDVDKVKQVLTNLIGNSLKFTDEGSITVSVEMGEKGMAEIQIIDTGCGIAKEDQEKLFGKFQQADVKGDRPAGTGLGLFISREMIRKMGGELWIKKSEVGKGSIFAFTLPIIESVKAKSIKEEIEKEAEFNPDQK